MAKSFTVLLYYKYALLSDPDGFAQQHRVLCAELGLCGRILIGSEGINGTVAGEAEATERYQVALKAHPEFKDTAFKVSFSEKPPFERMIIKVRPEIVTLGTGEMLHSESPLPHLSPPEWKRMIEEEKDVVLFDVRNRYESDVGHFKGAIMPQIENFRDLPAALGQYEHLKDKTVLMYCTGGIRCEKASVLFRDAGFKRVFQLEGGIVSYGEQCGDAHWEGDCFVFDSRMTIPVGGSDEKLPIGRCAHTGVPTRNVVNCLHDLCHKMILVDPAAIERDANHRLCKECLSSGLTWETADYRESPARRGRL